MKTARALVVATVSAALLCAGTSAVGASTAVPTAVDAPDPRTDERPTDRGDLAPLAAPAPSTGQEFAPDRVLVSWAPRTSGTQKRSALDAAGVTAADAIPGTSYTEVAVGDEDPETVVARLAEDPRVADVQLDHVRRATQWTADPALESTWPYFDLLRLPRAWDASTGAGVTVAVLDTGVSPHADLGGLLPGADLVTNDGNPRDPLGHGTLVAGVIAARSNTVGSVGAAYDAQILPVRVLDELGEGPDSRIAAGIAYAVSQGATVINLSLAGPDESPVLLDAIESAVAAGAVVVAAAGNDGTDAPQYPAAYAPQVDGLLAVSATDDDGALTDFSTWGDWVSIAAPGYEIVGPDASSGTYVFSSGTSFAAPFVSGAAALVRAHASTMTPEQVEERLVQTARDAGPRGIDPYYGFGVLDAATAVTASDSFTAAAAVPLDRAAGDGGADDTARTAVAISGTRVSGAIAPEGDADWYRFSLSAPGFYRISADAGFQPLTSRALDPSLEVRSLDGALLGTADGLGLGLQDPTVLTFPMAAAGDVLVAVTNANGAASDAQYELTLDPTAQPFDFASTTAPASARDAVAVGDVTGDGIADVVGATAGETSFAVLPGAGGGRTGARIDVPVPSGAGWTSGNIALADVDGDADVDVLVGALDGVWTFTQSGGALTATSSVANPWSPREILPYDTDGDGDRDLVIAGQPTRIATNGGTGVFTLQPLDLGAATGMAAGRLDGDAVADLVVGNRIYLSTAGGLASAGTAMPGLGLDEIALGDVTGDGANDLVHASLGDGTIAVEPGRGDGTFGSTVRHSLPFLSVSTLRLGDVDGDAKTDVVALTPYSGLAVLLQRGGSLAGPTVVPLAQAPGTMRRSGLSLADLDGNGSLDAVTVGSNAVNIAVQRSRTDTEGRAWVSGITPGPHVSGAQRRPTVTVLVDRDLRTPLPATVRLVDADGAEVPATRTYSTNPRRILLTPTVDLDRGSHYEVVVGGLVDASGDTQDEPLRSWFTVAAGGDRFTPIDPVRIADTRLDDFGAVASGEEVQLDLSPLPADATSVVLSVVSAGHGSLGNVRVFPTKPGAPVPTVASLNLVPGVDQPNLVTVAIGQDRMVSLVPDGPTTHLIVDLFGYYSPGGGTAFEPLDPTRVLDTRNGTGVTQGPLTGGHWVDLKVAGTGSVPADASAVVLNVAGTSVAGRLFVSVYPSPDAGYPDESPGTSNLNLYPGRDQSNLVTVKVGDGGRIRFWVNTSSTHLVADLAGYYSATGDNGFVPVTPVRMADTRTSSHLPGILRAGVPVDLELWRAPFGTDATAVVLNIAGVGPRSQTHVRAFPTTVPATLPLISTINLAAGRDESNLAIVRVGDRGRITLYAHSSDTHLVVDAFGYFRTYR